MLAICLNDEAERQVWKLEKAKLNVTHVEEGYKYVMHSFL